MVCALCQPKAVSTQSRVDAMLCELYVVSVETLLVSEAGLEPARPYRSLGPQPSASTYSATPTCEKLYYPLHNLSADAERKFSSLKAASPMR